MRNPIKKCISAVVTAVAVAVAIATPAYAAPGTVVPPSVLRIGAETIDLATPIPDDCTDPLPDNVVDVDLAGGANVGTWTAAGTIKARFHLAPPNHVPLYQMEIQFLAADGTYAVPAPPPWAPRPPGGPTHAIATVGPNHIVADLKVFALTEPDCVKDVLICQMRTRLVSTFGQANLVNPPGIVPGDWMQLFATSAVAGGVNPVAVGPCAAVIAATMVGQAASFDPITLVF